MKFSQPINELAAALATASALFQPVIRDREVEVKTKDGGKYFYTYADLANVIDATIQALSSNGLSLVTTPLTVNGGVEVVTLLLHSSGQWIESEPLFMACGSKAQEVGSAITYARRYQVQAMLNVAAEADEDGQAAQASSSSTQPTLPERRSQPKPTGKAEPARLTDDTVIKEIRESIEALAFADDIKPADVWYDTLKAEGIRRVDRPDLLLAADGLKLRDALARNLRALEAVPDDDAAALARAEAKVASAFPGTVKR